MEKKWDEKKVKSILIDHLLGKKEEQHIICSEVPFLAGKRWVDILELKEDSFTAYEIKSELDSFEKLHEQLKDYIETFNEVYVVLSKKFMGKHKSLPKNVGYFWIDTDKEEIIMKRKAKGRKTLKKENLSYFLWKKDISRHLKKYKGDVISMRDEFIKKTGIKSMQNIAIEALRERYEPRFELFLKEKGEKTHFSEISVLTKKETSIV